MTRVEGIHRNRPRYGFVCDQLNEEFCLRSIRNRPIGPVRRCAVLCGEIVARHQGPRAYFASATKAAAVTRPRQAARCQSMTVAIHADASDRRRFGKPSNPSPSASMRHQPVSPCRARKIPPQCGRATFQQTPGTFAWPCP